MNKIVCMPDSINAKLALKILTNELLGCDYICCECSCSGNQANAMIVRDILKKYSKVEVKLLDGKVYGESEE